ncbi:MAG: glycerophosphodiester phosphodiesterase family protein, partial [Pirellulaceae bacterium]
MNQIWPAIKRDFARCWKRLFLANLFFKIIAFVLLTPLVAGLFRLLVTFSGEAVLADQEIAFFFLSPIGWLCLIVLGSVWLAIGAMELATLISIVAVPETKTVRPLEALRFSAGKSWQIIQVTARMVGIGLLILAPFLIAAAIAYFTLLSEHDINFYLTERPPEFIAAIVIAALIVVALFLLFLRLYANWFYAVPLVLLEDVAPARALRLSRERTTGHRRRIVIWLAGWLLVTTIVSSLTAGVVIGVSRWLVPAFSGSLSTLVVAAGVSLLVWALVNLAVTLFTDSTFALLNFSFYRQLGASDEFAPDQLPIGKQDSNQPLLRITRTRVIVAGVIGVVIAIALGAAMVGSIRFEDQVEIMAHRGASAAAPENTMAAVRQAIVDDADWVEIDVQETADGEVVVFHDSDFMKLARNPLKIWEATMDDLQHIDIGSWFDPRFSNERVPTLRQVLEECQGKIGVNIELKYYGHDKQLEQRVVDIVEECGMQNEIVVMSLKMDAVRKMKSLRPDWRVGLLMSVAAGNLKDIEADFLAINASFVDFSFVQSAHSIGKQVFVWTVNDAVGMSRMISKG